MRSDVTPSGIPIFILSHARTGSTLMRYILDTHPDLCCPPEIALGRLCHALGYTVTLTLGLDAAEADESTRKSAVRGAVRSHVDAIMDAYCAAKKKKRWCDKSTNNVEHLDLIGRYFPDAQFVCLHRNCLDVVHSLLEMFRYGFPGRYGYFVSRSPDNIVEAMMATWIEATQKLLEFEAVHAPRCFRVKYEAMVETPTLVFGEMFSFLDLPFHSSLLGDVFSSPHDAGPGDMKIQFTSGIVRGRIGKGSQVPRRTISDECLRHTNTLHDLLGYPRIDRDGGPALEGVLRAASNLARPVKSEQWG